jgi:hypothetical protein
MAPAGARLADVVFANATFNTQVGNNDEYTGTFTSPAPGSFIALFRVSLDDGATWTACDRSGAGSNGGLDFSFADVASISVTR